MTGIRIPAAGESEPGTSVGSWFRRLRKSWIVLLAVYGIGFGFYGSYVYVTLDPEQSRVPIRPDMPLHYPLLTVHVLTGAVAVVLAWAQVWPWLRTTYPRVHRRIGWVYFLAGVIPSSLTAFPVAVLTPAGQAVRGALLVMSALWLVTVIGGFRAALQRRFDDHRRWMLRNVALATSIVTSRCLGILFTELTYWLLPETYGHQERLVFEEMSATGLWVAVVLHLFFVEWYLLRPRRRGERARSLRRAANAGTS